MILIRANMNIGTFRAGNEYPVERDERIDLWIDEGRITYLADVEVQEAIVDPSTGREMPPLAEWSDAQLAGYVRSQRITHNPGAGRAELIQLIANYQVDSKLPPAADGAQVTESPTTAVDETVGEPTGA